MVALQPSAPAKKGEPSDAGRKGPPQPTGPCQPWWTGVMDRRFVKSFEPLATFTKSLVNAGGMKLSHKSACAAYVPLVQGFSSRYVLRTEIGL